MFIVTVTYIINVCCSEIYPHWERAAIEANVHAQVSFALNRLFTHWYRSRGRNFDITNTYQFDQVFIEGRNIFQNIANIVNGIFNQFIRRPGRREPLFASYCNGSPTTVESRCAGMSQHGSQLLAQQGRTALQILRFYYPQDINIVQSTNFGPRNPGAYPGTALRLGSTGENVRRIQLYLNRIAGNWWIRPFIQNPNGVFEDDTRALVIAFQNQFNLTPDGVVGPITWYEITRIYVAARRLAELDSEGQRYSIGSNPPTTTISQNDRNEAVVELQFLLNFIGQFYHEIPFVVEDGVFRAATSTSVIAFQRRFGLTQDGVVGPVTWATLYRVYRDIRGTVPPIPEPPGTPSVPPFPGMNLLMGSQGPSVTTVQTRLNQMARCYPSIEVLVTDGIFGPRTQGAVREFQRLFGLAIDGIVGQNAWYRLMDESNLLQGADCPPVPPQPPPTTGPPFPGVNLRNGSRGENVRLIQERLNALGASPRLAVDGIFGPRTEAAVRAFQQANSLSVDGIVGPITWGALFSGQPAPPTTWPPFPGVNLRLGSQGPSVRQVQERLNQLGANPRLAVDGIFGPRTQAAVRIFQQNNGLSIDGIVGPITWGALFPQSVATSALEETVPVIKLVDDPPPPPKLPQPRDNALFVILCLMLLRSRG